MFDLITVVILSLYLRCTYVVMYQASISDFFKPCKVSDRQPKTQFQTKHNLMQVREVIFFVVMTKK